MRTVFKVISNIYEVLLRILIAILSSFTLLILILISIQVYTRYFFSSPVLWTTDIATYLLLGLGLPGAAWLLRNDDHVNIDLVINAFSKKFQAVINIVMSIIGTLTCASIVWGGTLIAYNQYVRNVVVIGEIYFPKYILMISIPVGAFFLTIEFIRKVLYYYNLARDLQSSE